MATNWLKLKDEYLHTPLSLKGLAAKHHLPCDTLKRRAAKEGWAAAKRGAAKAAGTGKAAGAAKTADAVKAAETAKTAGTVKAAGTAKVVVVAAKALPAASPPATPAERIARLRAIGDKLTDRLERATVELDKQMLTRKRKSGARARSANNAPKPPDEPADSDDPVIVDALVDCAGLQKLSVTLRNLREILHADAGEGQSVGMVAELMKRLDDEAGKEDA